jgi:hypothetical protein
MSKPLSMDAVNRVNVAIKKLRELILALDVYDDRLFIMQVNGMINQLQQKIK